MSFDAVHDGPAPQGACVVLERSWPTCIGLKEGIVAELLDAVTSRGWLAGDDAYWLQLCLEEVVINAMLHGNEGDPNLPVHGRIHDLGASWAIEISDQGSGFRVEDLPDHEDPASLLLEHGRGILLMREWLDRLAYYRQGATAWLERHKCEQRKEIP